MNDIIEIIKKHGIDYIEVNASLFSIPSKDKVIIKRHNIEATIYLKNKETTNRVVMNKIELLFPTEEQFQEFKKEIIKLGFDWK